MSVIASHPPVRKGHALSDWVRDGLQLAAVAALSLAAGFFWPELVRAVLG